MEREDSEMEREDSEMEREDSELVFAHSIQQH
jgi:hypothetical protein